MKGFAPRIGPLLANNQPRLQNLNPELNGLPIRPALLGRLGAAETDVAIPEPGLAPVPIPAPQELRYCAPSTAAEDAPSGSLGILPSV